MQVRVVSGDLLDQPVEVLVNAWNRNVIPWWLLLPQGVSGAIKKKAGLRPFRELPWGPIPLGGAVVTSAGRLPHKAIIHVAAISMAWRASEDSIRRSVLSAIEIAHHLGFRSMAFPVLGSGSGGFAETEALRLIEQTLASIPSDLEVWIVRPLRCRLCHRRGQIWEPWGGGPLTDSLCWWHGLKARVSSASTCQALAGILFLAVMAYALCRMVGSFLS